MKKIVSFLFISCFFLGVVLAKQIDEKTAKNAGQQFLANSVNSSTLKNASELLLAYKVSGENDRFSNNALPVVYFYVFNSSDSHGFVIVSGDDRVIPILGYSDQKIFTREELPPHVRAWLDGYKNQIKYAIDNDLVPTEKIRSEWEQLSNNGTSEKFLKKATGVSPLVQTQWDQSPYYNALCPFDNQYGELTVTGCVATAMAQIMKYWNYPENGTGFHSYNTNSYGTLSADFAGTVYQWGAMPNALSGANTAVATLMYHCGVGVDMNYGVGSQGGSSAYMISSQSPVTNCSEYALKNYFGYPTSMQGIDRAGYNESQWTGALKAELDANRPVLYAGFGSGGGHCFVCDGYDQNGFFHFNWGWSGSYDGYFPINALNPGGVGTGGGTGGFNSGHQALIGIQAPGGGGGQTADLKLYGNLTPSAGTIYYGEAFSVTTDILNAGTNNFNGDYCTAVFDNSGAFVDFVEIFSGQSLPAGYHYTNGVTFSSSGLLSMLPGTYYLAVYFKPTGGNWMQVADNGNYINLIQISVINPNDIELYSALNLIPGSTLTQGGAVSVNFDVGNYGTTTFNGILDVSLYNLDGSFAFTINQLTNVSLPPNTHFTNGLTFSNTNLNVEPGTYLLAVQHQRTGENWEITGSTNYQNPIFITVQSADLLVDMYEPDNSVSQAYNLPVSFNGNSAAVNTQGSNCHFGSDYDFYKIELPAGFSYTIAAELFNANHQGKGTYTLAGLYSYSTDGTTWSDAYEGILPNNIVVHNGGTVYFYVSPQFTGETGTYLLSLGLDKNPLGFPDSKMPDQIKVYPVPAKENITIDLNSFTCSVSEIRLINTLGKVVKEYTALSDQDVYNLSVMDLPDGIYFIQLQSDKGVLSKEITIMR
jgi:hypothetical protein